MINCKYRYTVVELLVVVAVTAVLVSLIIPAIAVARRQALSISCRSSQRQMAMSFFGYASDWNNFGPTISGSVPCELSGYISERYMGIRSGASGEKFKYSCLDYDSRLMIDSEKVNIWKNGRIRTAYYLTFGIYTNNISGKDCKWYGWKSSLLANNPPCPNLNYLGSQNQHYDEIEGASYTITLKSPANVVGIGDFANRSGMVRAGVSNPWRMSHFMLGSNCTFLDGHVGFIPFAEFGSAVSMNNFSGDSDKSPVSFLPQIGTIWR